MNEQTAQIQIIQPEPEEEIHLGEYIKVLKRRWWIIVISFFVVVAITIVYLIKTPRTYEATAVVKLPVSGSSGGLAQALGSILPLGQSVDLATEIEVIKGRDIAEIVIRDLGIDKKPENQGKEITQLASNFHEILKVNQKGKTNLISITASSVSPEEAKNIANKVADEYIKKSKASFQETWNNLIGQMEIKLSETRKDLEVSRKLLHEYESEKGITTAFSSVLLGSNISGTGTQYIGTEIPQAVAELKSRTMQMELQLENLRKYYPEENPDIVKLKNQIAENKQKLKQEEEKFIDKYNKQFGLTKLAAEVAFKQQLLSSLISKQEELKAQYIMQNKAPELIESALEPIYPSAPKRKLILMLGMVLGVFLGLGLALVREFFDNTIHNAEDVKKFTDINILGSIPQLKSSHLTNNSNIYLITNSDPTQKKDAWIKKLYKESYRMLQLELESAIKLRNVTKEVTDNQGGKILMVTSPIPDENKSLIVSNLAISIAQTGKRVLVVNIDFSNRLNYPISEFAEASLSKGFVNYVMGDLKIDDIVIDTNLDNLYLISAGENSQADLTPFFFSSKADDVLKSFKEKFDFVIFDTPPVTLASESIAIGSKVDYTIIVVKANTTDRDSIIQSKQIIENSGGKIIGAVLNSCSLDKKYYKHYKQLSN
ncbi:MAG: GumC family protein [bacterium]